MTATAPQVLPSTPAKRALQLPRFAKNESGLTRLPRRLGPVRGFPKSLKIFGQSISVVHEPELILLVDLLNPPEGEYRLRYTHDVICQAVLAHEGTECTVNVNFISSRTTPAFEAVLDAGSVKPSWLSLSEVDDAICAVLNSISIRGKFTDSIDEFISRWITEYSLKAIASLKDDAVAAALRARDKSFYEKVLAYLDSEAGVNAETISKHLRTALVAPKEIEELIARQAAGAAGKAKPKSDFERTMELRVERAKRD